MKRGDYLGMKVRLLKDMTIPIQYLPDGQMLPVKFTTSEEFVVERDFRYSESDGIRVALSDGSWMALTSEQFKDMFGSDVLRRLDAIRYDDDKEVGADG